MADTLFDTLPDEAGGWGSVPTRGPVRTGPGGVRQGGRSEVRLRFDATDPALAAAAWSRLAEPGDEAAGALVQHLGAVDALEWVLEAVRAPGRAEATLRRILARASSPGRPAHAADLPGRILPVPAGGPAAGGRGPVPTGGAGLAAATAVEPAAVVTPDAVGRLLAGVRRWSGRLPGLDPEGDLKVLARYDGTLLVPGDPRWPAGLDDLGAISPFALWVRGSADLGALVARSVAVVGSRACTDYGAHVGGRLAAGLTHRGFTVVSGGAYGVDTAVHHGALAAGGPTVAFLAGGVDRLYPAGNSDLLRRTTEEGAVVSEVPPGSVPGKQRFLKRNRLIAAVTGATIVVEASVRSGALSTANHATRLFRPLGVVPGPVTSMASAGCHELLRQGAAVCVTDAAEAAELAGHAGVDAAPERQGETRPGDDLDPAGRAVLDALPVRQAAAAEAVARVAGLSVMETLGALGILELRGLAENQDGSWRLRRS
ncbi:DNA-processing protein DprA [Antribacter gilvus]|uniref:DNA-processing protein DprA n=1 Tax=Antribacter gilvus TaxID=2304675 RepID=UPI000F765F0F|nr:DNA-processing protein DprA [Antribacter gilvus]